MAETDEKSGTKEAEPAKPEKPKPPPPPLVMRALLGFSGLAMLVGFFLPWVRVPALEGATDVHFQNGMDLVLAADIEGTPAALVVIIPILGGLLSAVAFMGLRYAAQTAVGVAVVIIGYALYVLGAMFVQNTSYGLWIVSGGTFLLLLLGVATWMLARRTADAPIAPEPSKK